MVTKKLAKNKVVENLKSCKLVEFLKSLHHFFKQKGQNLRHCQYYLLSQKYPGNLITQLKYCVLYCLHTRKILIYFNMVRRVREIIVVYFNEIIFI